MAEQNRTRVLILGGGFAGVYTALTLEKYRNKIPNLEIGLVSKENYLVFQPMLPEVISGSIGIVDTITPIQRLCPHTTLYQREVESIDLANKTVTMSSGFRPHPYQLKYDHLVLGLGNVTSFAGLPGLMEYALPFKYLGDALILRNRILHALAEADIEDDPELRRALLTFVVAGGGFSGVEAVAEMNDFVRNCARNFKHIRKEDLKIVLLHAQELILPELPQSLARFAQQLLLRRGVEIRLSTRLAGATSESALLATGEKIPCKTLVSTVPAAPNPVIAALPCKKERDRIVANEYLEVPGYPGVWAAGDCAWIIDHETGEPCPPTAQHAIRQARRLAKNLVATLTNELREPFHFKALGKLAALGHRSAVAEVFNFKVSGLLAWFLWRSIYLMKLPSLERKVRVAMDWTLDMLLPPDIVQLRTEHAAGFSREHFEAGETIFRQGDCGDRLYIVIDGEVLIVRSDANVPERVLARLKAGECFGEMALVGNSLRMATAKTASAVNLMSVDRDAFQSLFRHLPPLRGLVQQWIRERLEQDALSTQEVTTQERGRGAPAA
jgi:NADH:ubiquinone reductase (H+-translocating)